MAETLHVLITGATSGIGLATAEAFAAGASKSRPLHLVLAGRRTERLAKIKKTLTKKGVVTVDTAALDVRSRKAVDAFAKAHAKFLRKVDVLLNNAGLAAGRDAFQDASLDDWEAMLDTNVKGLLYVTRKVLPGMIARESGHIVNLGSVAGHYAYPQGAVYCASKFAVRAINEGLRMDLLGKNIRVTSIDPGMVETEFSLVRFKGDTSAADAVYKGMRPLRPEDVAASIVWAVSQPTHVNVQQMILMPTDQGSIRDVSRKSR